MSVEPNALRQMIEKARTALRDGDTVTARRWAEQASRLAPDTEEPWLILTAVSEPRAALEHAKRALVVNPNSSRARKALEWARSRLPAEEAAQTPPPPSPAPASNLLASLPRVTAASPSPAAPTPKTESPTPKKKNRRSIIYLSLLIGGILCIAVAFAGMSAMRNPVVASILSPDSQPAATATAEGPYAAEFDLALPSETPSFTFTPSALPTATFTRTPQPTFTSTITFTPEFTFTPESTSTPLPTDTPAITETPGQMEAVVLEDTPTSAAPPTKPYVAPTQPASYSGGNGERWIDVNLSQQMVYAYEGDVLVNSFLASTGTWQTPTVTGSYKIYVKYVSTRMTGPGYNLPNVPYTMYFYKGYGIHGTYWHNNFGVPMSHGCVNLSIPDAEWIYYWASVGTVVNVHY